METSRHGTRSPRLQASNEPYGRSGWILLALAVATGVVLRLHEISSQIIGDDEWHALHVIPSNGYGFILTHLGACDYAMPMTLYFKAVSDTIGLTEMLMRAPMLAAGVASLIVLPLLARPYLGAGASLTFAWLLAISPLHVYYSRSARPYAFVFLLAAVGAIASERWLTTGRRRWAWAYAACAALVPWFHFAYLPFMAAPLMWIVVATTIAARRERVRWWSCLPSGFVPVAAAVIVGWGVLLGPALWVDGVQSLTRDSIALRGGKVPFPIAPPVAVFELWSGAQRPLLAFACGVALLAGLLGWKRRPRRWMGYLAALVACEIAAFALVRPFLIDTPIVFVRYALPALAVYLMISAAGFEYLDDRLRDEWARLPRHACSTVVVLSLLAFGPLWQAYYRPNNWTNAAIFQYRYAPEFRGQFASSVLNVGSVPDRYAKIALAADAEDRIVEAPWCYEWNRMPYVLYQRDHRRPMLIGWVDDPSLAVAPGELPWPDPRFRFANCVHLGDFDGLRERRARFVILHRNVVCGGSQDGRELRAAAMTKWIERYREFFGEPFCSDDEAVVFDIRRD